MKSCSKNKNLDNAVKQSIEEQIKEDMNRDLDATIKQIISEPSNLEIEWAVFRDELIFYRNKTNKKLGNSRYFELINNIEIDANQYITDNLDLIDFSSYENCMKDINKIIFDFVTNVLDNRLYEMGNSQIMEGSGYYSSHIIILRQMALLAYNQSHYGVAMELHTQSKTHLSLVADVKRTPVFFRHKVSELNKHKANNRWSKHNKSRPEKKKRYLQIMDEKNFTTFSETAEYIKQHIETDKKPSYDTIKRWLSQASKGDFS